jgi:PAS domain S-box-containing protein
MLAAIDWFVSNWEAIAAISALIGSALEWIRRRVKKIVDMLGTVNNKLGDVQQEQTNQAAITSTMSRRVAGMIARQRDAFNDDPVPRFETDQLGQFEYANQAMLDLLDWPLDALRGKGWEACVFGEDRPHAIEEIDDAFDDKRFVIVSFRIVSRGGDLFTVTCFVKPLVCEAHIVTGFTGRFTKVAPVSH